MLKLPHHTLIIAHWQIPPQNAVIKHPLKCKQLLRKLGVLSKCLLSLSKVISCCVPWLLEHMCSLFICLFQSQLIITIMPAACVNTYAGDEDFMYRCKYNQAYSRLLQITAAILMFKLLLRLPHFPQSLRLILMTAALWKLKSTPAAFYDECPLPPHCHPRTVYLRHAVRLPPSLPNKEMSACAFQRLRHYNRKRQPQMKASLLIQTSSSIPLPIRTLLRWWHMF